MTKTKYKVLAYTGPAFEKWLNEKKEEGWTLVSFSLDNNNFYCVFEVQTISRR